MEIYRNSCIITASDCKQILAQISKIVQTTDSRFLELAIYLCSDCVEDIKPDDTKGKWAIHNRHMEKLLHVLETLVSLRPQGPSLSHIRHNGFCPRTFVTTSGDIHKALRAKLIISTLKRLDNLVLRGTVMSHVLRDTKQLVHNIQVGKP